MKRYRLLKDLPTFNVGDEFYLDNNDNLCLVGQNTSTYNHDTLKEFPNILKDWFEEFYISERWRADYNGSYYYIDSGGNVIHSCDCEDEDDYRYNTGNYFKTKEEAESYKNYLIARQILLDDSEGGKYSYSKENWCVSYDAGEWILCWTYRYSPSRIYFKDEKSLKHFLKAHKEQWETVRKYETGEM